MNLLPSPVNFVCSVSGDWKSLPHFWEHTVGSGHATLALRADWQKQLVRCHRELGFRHVRFHGILSDDMGTLVCQQDKLVYSFFNADQICEFLLSIGMRPFMELSFMPTTLSSGSATVFHYRGNVTPPQDYAAWEKLIYTLVQHWLTRYGETEVTQWFFEIWNEPNLKAFWTAEQSDYFRLYQYAARAIKRVHGDLKVGGPATADNAWISEFLAFCKTNDAPVDFISTHHYPTDDFGKPGDNTKMQLAQSRRSVLRDEVSITKSKAQNKPVYYTEWSTSSNPFDELHDLPYAAAFITKTVMEAQGYVDGYSYWTFSDIFEENYFSSVPFHGGFGLLNIYGVPKPSYRAYQLLHHLGSETRKVDGNHPTVDAWMTRKNRVLKIMLTNSALPTHPVKSERLQIQLTDIGPVKTAYVERIDDSHANARSAWAEMGQPNTLTPEQVETLESASSLTQQPIEIVIENGTALVELMLPPQGTACLTLELP